MFKDTVLTVTEDETKQLKKLLYTKSDTEIENYLTSLKEWIKKQQHLPQNEEDYILRQMLMLNKFSVERTKSKLEVYYSAKKFIPELFTDNYPLHPSIQKYYDASFFLPLPLLTRSLERLTVIALPKNCSTEDFDPLVFHRLLFTTIEIRLGNDLCIGDIFIIDFTFLSFSIASKISPRLLQNSIKFLIGAYSDRVKQIHFINVPTFAQTMITLVKSILKNKMAERVQVHKDVNSLRKYISPEVLPSDLGGTMKSLKELQDNWRKFLISRNDWIIGRTNMQSNEKLRIGAPVSSDMFGIQGSFQQLIID